MWHMHLYWLPVECKIFTCSTLHALYFCLNIIRYNFCQSWSKFFLRPTDVVIWRHIFVIKSQKIVRHRRRLESEARYALVSGPFRLHYTYFVFFFFFLFRLRIYTGRNQGGIMLIIVVSPGLYDDDCSRLVTWRV